MKIKKLFVGALLIGSAIGLVVTGALFWPRENEARTFSSSRGDVQSGAYLARASGCFACHTNEKKKGPVLAGGGPLKTPFGTFYAPNITTHPVDGIGKWSLAQFSQALTHGIGPDGKNYYPVFLYPNYSKLSNQDIVDMWAAFQTVPPIANKVPPHDLKFPFQFRFLVTAWKRLFFFPKPYENNPKRSKEWNRGAFLATGPAHCVTCHSPKNPFGALDYGHALNGDADGIGGEKIPAITATALKKNGWSKTDIVFALKTGSKPNGDAFGSSMGEVVRESTRFLSDEDLNAIADFIMSVEHINGKSVVKTKQ